LKYSESANSPKASTEALPVSSGTDEGKPTGGRMTKKDFIALADLIKMYNRNVNNEEQFTTCQIQELASFCKQSNSAFKADRWMDYINGKCGPNGGAIS
jgi:hypothetical protein